MYSTTMAQRFELLKADCEGAIKKEKSNTERMVELLKVKSLLESKTEKYSSLSEPMETFEDPELLVGINHLYKKGTRVRLVHKASYPSHLAGSLGTVEYFDAGGYLHIKWDERKEIGVIQILTDVVEIVYPIEVILHIEKELSTYIEAPANLETEDAEEWALQQTKSGNYTTISSEVTNVYFDGIEDSCDE